MFGNDNPNGDDIRKFESQGTRSFATEQAIRNAIEFQLLIGNKRKEERLRFLKNYWTEKAVKLPKAKLFTAVKPEFSCAVATFGFEGWQAQQIDAKLMEKHKVHCVSMILEKVNGVRIAPNVYSNTQDLDILVKGLTEISKMDPPAAPTK